MISAEIGASPRRKLEKEKEFTSGVY